MPSTEKRCLRLSNGRSTSSSDAPPSASSDWGSTIQRWLPVIVWATFISWFSTDAFSARSTNSYIDPVLRFLFGELTPAGFRFAHSLVRKSAHLIEYAILGMLTARAQSDAGAPLPRSVMLRTLAYCAVYAMLDEAHQTFVPSRTGSPIDVIVDTTGATLGTLLFAGWRNRISDRFRARASNP
jgi:VanZ family protein